MRSADIEINNVRPLSVPGEGWDILAQFDADIGDFRIRGGKLCRRHDGFVDVSLSGERTRNRLTLPKGCDTRNVLTEMVREEWEAFQ